MRDLLDASAPEWKAERASVETEGWGARLLSCEGDDGQCAGGAFFPRGFEVREWQESGQPWTATSVSLTQLREFGLDPASAPARRAVELIGANSRWDEGGQARSIYSSATCSVGSAPESQQTSSSCS